MLHTTRTTAVALGALIALTAASSHSAASTDSAASSDSVGSVSDEQPVVRVMTIAPTNVGTWDPQHFKTYSALAESEGWDLEIAEAVPYGEAEQVLSGWGE